MSFSQRLMLSAIATGCLVGCQGALRPDGARPTHPTTVTVTYNGAPVEGASVTMVDSGSPPAPSFGTTDAQGVAKMRTSYADGAVEGRHQVAVSKSETTGGAPAVDQDSADYDPNAAEAPAQVKGLLPKKYSNRMTSGLSAEVKSGKNDFKFELTD